MSGIRSSDSLTCPEVWTTRPLARYWVTLAGLSLIMILALIIAVYLLVSGQSAMAAIALLFAISFSGILVLGIDGRLRVRKADASSLSTRVDRDGRHALSIPYSAIQFSGYLVVMTGFAVMFLVGAIGGVLDPSIADGGAAVFALIGLFFVSFPVLVLSGSFARGHILVSPDGVYQRGWTYEAYLPWSSITTVQPERFDGPEVWAIANEHDQQWQSRQITRLWRQDRVPAHPMIRISGKDIGTDLVLVYYLLGFYLLHPQNRAELGTDAALDRARRAAYT